MIGPQLAGWPGRTFPIVLSRRSCPDLTSESVTAPLKAFDTLAMRMWSNWRQRRPRGQVGLPDPVDADPALAVDHRYRPGRAARLAQQVLEAAVERAVGALRGCGGGRGGSHQSGQQHDGQANHESPRTVTG